MSLTLAAREAMPDGGRFTLQVDVVERDGAGSGLPPGAYVALRASDTSAGLEPAAMDKVFEPFFTTRGQGTGLGLAIALGVARAHGGTIDVSSIPSQGSEFVLQLPCSSGGEERQETA
jgi:signal transduction histidine kinase